MRIAIDAGHGGDDPGAVVGDTKEKTIALAYARSLRNRLERRHRVLMTRDDDVFVPLGTRATKANAWGADAFVSIHANASSTATANGAWVLHHVGSVQGKAMAYSVFQEMRKIPGIEDADDAAEVYPDRSGWTGGRSLAVLRETSMPAILVELGFMTNREDLDQILNMGTRDEVARAIATGLDKWWRSLECAQPLGPAA